MLTKRLGTIGFMLIWLGYGHSSIVEFPSGSLLEPVDEATLDASTAAEVADPLNTGTPLYVVRTPMDDNLPLSHTFRVRDFRYPGSALDYYRAHPAIFQCLQKVHDHVLHSAKKTVRIASGYLTASQVGPSPAPHELYARTGCGVTLDVAGDGATTEDDVERIAEAVMTYCPFIFAREMRDIGVVAATDRLYVYMADPTTPSPHYASAGYSKLDTPQFAEWCREKIDAALLPHKLPECSHVTGLEENKVFPEGLSMDQAVGSLDEAITRDSPDFKRLLQFASRHVEAEDAEAASTWCGKEGVACAACGGGVTGHALNSRCADRLMSPRLYNVIKSLHALVFKLMGVKLRVVEAWDEGHSGAAAGDTASGSVHREGRAAVLQLSGGNRPQDITLLTQYALCAGADYVKNDGDRVTIAVKKQAGLEKREVQFVMTSLLEVSPPPSVADNYTLPASLNPKQFPLFDSDNQESVSVGEESTVGEWMSPGARSFRLHPALVQCYDKLQQSEQNWVPDIAMKLEIVRGYLTEHELRDVFAPANDRRGRGHVTGTAMHLIYPASAHGGKFAQSEGTHFNAHRLARAVIVNCAPIFSEYVAAQAGAGSGLGEMGVGVYGDGVYVDMREDLQVWVSGAGLLPVTESERTLEQAYWWAVDYRMFNPSSPLLACSMGTPPLAQAPDYQYEHSHYVHERRRRRRQAEGEEQDCTPQTDTPFCDITAPFRENEVEHIWREASRKYMRRNEDDVRGALEKCFDTCGTCRKGAYWEEKVEHCNNLLHWLPFELMNEAADVTNLYYRGNRGMKTYACHGTRHCVDKAPLFAMLAPSVEALYRPNPQRSIEDELYDALDNPSPVPELTYELYGMHANGTVNVWVQDATEMEYLRRPLKSVMVYNRRVTQVNVYVIPASASASTSAADGAASTQDVKAAVAAQLDAMRREWTAGTCPSYARVATPPVAFKDVHAGIARRDIHNERDFSEELAMKRHQFESHWVARTLS